MAMIGGSFVAEGEPSECALWAFTMAILDRKTNEKEERDAAEKEADAFAEILGMTMDELRRREMEGGDG